MTYRGRVEKGVVVLDDGVQLAEGTPVQVAVLPADGPRRGSAAAVQRLAGTLSDAEADVIDQAARQCRRIDRSVW